MRHFSCDLCGKDLTPGMDARYVVRMTIAPAADPAEPDPAGLDQDQITQMAELLEELEAAGDDVHDPEPTSRAIEYDLCGGCHRKFVADPLGRDAARKLEFSAN